jgi:hypothetical protein
MVVVVVEEEEEEEEDKKEEGLWGWGQAASRSSLDRALIEAR